MPDVNSANANAPDGSSPTPDVVINRTNVALARSERILQSWLRPATPAENLPAEDTRFEDEELFNESSGLGSKTTTDDLDEFGLRHGKKASNDKLLEQLLGKKGAAAKRKQDAAQKQEIGTGVIGKSKMLVQQPKKERKRAAESEEEDGGGRATAFKSRRPRNEGVRSNQYALGTQTDIAAGQSGDTDEGAVSPGDDDCNAQRSNETPRKRKPISYLDEVLAKSSRKKSKGKPPG